MTRATRHTNSNHPSFTLNPNAVHLTVRGELVEPPATHTEPFDKLRANGNFIYVNSIALNPVVGRDRPFDTPAVQSTQGERSPTKTVTTTFVLSALRSKVYRSMNGVPTAGI